MSESNCLFVGGPRDGEVLTVDDSLTTYRVVQPKMFSGYKSLIDARDLLLPTVLYFREFVIDAGDRAIPIFIADECRHKPIRALIDGYARLAAAAKEPK